VSQNDRPTSRVEVERVKPSRKVLYHFAIFAIVNEMLASRIRAIQRVETAHLKAILHAYGVRPTAFHALVGSGILIDYSITIANFAKWYTTFLFGLTQSTSTFWLASIDKDLDKTCVTYLKLII